MFSSHAIFSFQASKPSFAFRSLQQSETPPARQQMIL